ncbi:hypothetical protein FB451DRAFT_1558836 [Mycena latifolia]|nr:hypothetical protein FB451DRAFT_1558836 [Mycena latifolia]
MTGASARIFNGVALCIWFLAHSVTGYFPRVATQDATQAISSAVSILFSFDKIANMTTCTSAAITWSYGSTVFVNANITLSITNIGVAQLSPPNTTTTGTFHTNSVRAPENQNSVSRRDTLTQFVSPSISAVSRSYTWPLVDVPERWYVMRAAFDSGTGIESEPFYVANGTDTSCIRSSFVSVSASGPTSASQTISSTPNTSGNSSAPGTGSPTASKGVPAPQVHGSKINRGAIAGGVAGGLIVILAAIVLFRRRSRATSTPTNIPAPSPTPMPPVTLSPATGQTVLAFDRPIAPGVVESQEAMLDKLARMREPMRVLDRERSEAAVDTHDEARGEEEARLLVTSAPDPGRVADAPAQPGASSSGDRAADLEQQLQVMAERLALMEAHMQTHGLSEDSERPPDYAA